MTGVIWFVQVVTYPQFAQVGAEHFVLYHESYTRLVTWIVAPLMFLELGTAVGSVILLRGTPAGRSLTAGLLILIGLWMMTALVQVPQHERLAEGFDPEVTAALVVGNWWRTIGWSLRTLLLGGVLLQHASKHRPDSPITPPPSP